MVSRSALLQGALVAVDVGDSEKISEAAADHDSQARLDAIQRWIAALEQRLSNQNDGSFRGSARVARKLLHLRANVLRGAASRCLLRSLRFLTSRPTALLKLRFGFLSLAFLSVNLRFSP
jgi:hypothetical protein